MSFQSVPGVFDILPENSREPWKASFRWAYIESVMKEVAASFNYREIRTPIFERTELFLRGVGQETDIVSKEMYTFIDRGERSLTLRPEGTASVLRASIESQLFGPLGQKLFYLGPMFRYERMQAGRYRQFHQFGIESYGNPSPEQDVEIIDLAYQIFSRLGIRGLKIKINSLGDKEAREAFRTALVAFLEAKRAHLSEESQTRLTKNPLRVLDSKDPKDQAALQGAPSILDFLTEENRAHFTRVQELLALLNIPFEVDCRLVRGLDYYQKTVFEIISEDLGAQNTLCGGGRYDGLIKALGGPDLASTGFALGIERVLLVMLSQNLPFGKEQGPLLYLIPMGDKAREWSFQKIHELRQMGLACDLDLINKKVGKGIARAVELKARFAAVIGDRELEEHTVELKELATEQKTTLKLDALPQFLSTKEPLGSR